MSIEELDAIVDRVEMFMAREIVEIDNSQTDYVLEQLISRLEVHRDRIQAATLDE